MKKKLSLMLVALSAIALLAGCEPLTVFNPKGPNAETLSNTIILSIITMAFILLVVYVLLAFMLTKYRASKAVQIMSLLMKKEVICLKLHGQ